MSIERALSASYTSQQRAFIGAIVAGSDVTDAAITAGYEPEHANTIGNQMLHQPQIIAAVQIGVARGLAIAAPLALALLRRVVASEGMDMRLRVACAKTILDRAGHIAPKAIAASTGSAVPLNEMSMADLRTLADKLEGEIAGRAKDVSSAKPAPSKVQTIEDIM